MASEHDGRSDPKLTAMYVGTIVSNKDPDKLGRVKVRIAGLVEPESAWAHPLGWPGAGGKQRGTFDVPPEGADVGVFFHMGDPDHPYYFGGAPGRGEAPPEVETPEDNVKVKVWEGARFRVLIDEREGKETYQIKDKKSEDVIEFDGVNFGMHVKCTSTLFIECDGTFRVDAAIIQFGDRVMIQNGKVIK